MQVEEETGLDITDLLNKQDFIDAQLGDQDTRLFIVQASGAGAVRPVPCGAATPQRGRMHLLRCSIRGGGRADQPALPADNLPPPA